MSIIWAIAVIVSGGICWHLGRRKTNLEHTTEVAGLKDRINYFRSLTGQLRQDIQVLSADQSNKSKV